MRLVALRPGATGTLLARDLGNLLVAGRCHSATRRAASSSRVTCTVMSMGQAAGFAAAMAIKAKVDPKELSGAKVSAELDAAGCGVFRSE